MTHQPIVAIQMDPLEMIRVKTDTSFALGLEAQKRGYRLFVYQPSDLSYQDNHLLAKGQFVTFFDQDENYFSVQSRESLRLDQAQFVLLRQDPPFNMAYITTTFLLDLLPETTMVLNNPEGVRNTSEKLFMTHFPDLVPPTLLSRDIDQIAAFLDQEEAIILKPLYDFGGSGIFKLRRNDANFGSLIELYMRLYQEPFVVQKFLPEVALGDKRIIVIHGEPVGVFKRIPPEGQARSNMRIGGTAHPCDLSPRDHEICRRLSPFFKERGLALVGLDVIGDYVTEVNVTSPTGMRVMNRMYNLDLAVSFWNGVEPLKKLD
jgi:glutathione synthase